MATQDRTVTIKPPKFETAAFTIEGTAPYMQLRFSEKSRGKMIEKHQAGSTAGTKRNREARDFDDDYEQAKHVSEDGWVGIPASAFRNAMISACRTVGYKMTLAKLSVFVEADGLDGLDGTPLIKIEGDPEPSVLPVRNATGVVDLRVRPMWRKWGARVRVRWDSDQFTLEDVVNLLMRVGMQVGVGEGRPDSKSSAGIGYGMFAIAKVEELRSAA